MVCLEILRGNILFIIVATKERRLVLRLALAIATQQVVAVLCYFQLVCHICVTIRTTMMSQ